MTTGKHWFLSGGSTWPELAASGVSASAAGVRLIPTLTGPLGLSSSDESLGRLVLPRRFCVSGGELFLLSKVQQEVLRYERDDQQFVPLPGVGSPGEEARQFRDARNIAVAGRALFVADSGHNQVKVFDLATLGLARILTEVGDAYDLAALGTSVYVLDAKGGRVFKVSADRDRVEEVLSRPDRQMAWSRIAVDLNGLVCLLKPQPSPLLEVYAPGGRKDRAPMESLSDPAAARHRFPAPALELDPTFGFRLPAELAARCGHVASAAPEPVQIAETNRLRFELDTERSEVRAFLPNGQLRHVFGPRNRAGLPVRREDPEVWRPEAITARQDCTYFLDRLHQVVYRHTYGEETLAILDVSQWPGGETPSSPHPPSRELWFSGDGEPLEPPSPERRPADRQFPETGWWISKPLESELYLCRWDRIDLAASSLPAGVRITVKTCTYDTASDRPWDPGDPRWQEAATLVAPVQPSPEELSAPRQRFDMLIQSPPGRLLSVAILLQGTGYATPVVTSLRITYPRVSYLEFLPELYSSEQEMRTFLERLLGIFQSEWDELERRISECEANFDPDAVPPGAPMRELARWMALPLEATWSDDQNRKLLQTFPRIQMGRGTPSAMQEWLGVYLANIADVTPEAVVQSGFPAIQEGFVERRHLWLNEENVGGLGQSKPLWSPEVMRRLQLGGFSQAGEVALISTGDPDRDVFHYYAHRFRVYVPAAWIRTADEEAMLRRAIESEKPAHTVYDLELVQSRFRIGTQSTIGLDTIIGTPAGWQLPRAQNDPPPSREESSRLGYDTVLLGSPRSQRPASITWF